MPLDTLKRIFRASFDPTFLEVLGRETGAFQRIRDITPYHLLFALLLACFRGPRRSLAEARRQYGRIAKPVSPGAFDARIDSQGCVRWIWRLVVHLRQTSNRAERRAWPAALLELTDILIEDSSTCPLPKTAPFESTQKGQAAIKLMTTMSLVTGVVLDGRLAASVHHDRPLLRGPIVPGALYLRDLGFYDHGEFARIADGNARFVSRLKLNAIPSVKEIFEGLPPEAVGQGLTDALPYGPVVDLDAVFHVGNVLRIFRVIMVPVPAKDAKGRRLPGQTMQGWFVTNLSREVWDPVSISLLYRLRWTLERVFRRGKQTCGLGSLRSERPTVIAVLVGVSLIAINLAAWLAATLRASSVRASISDDVILLVLQTWLPDIARMLESPDLFEEPTWIRFRNALVYDARHRNTKQQLAHDLICEEIEHRTRNRIETLAA